MKSAIHLSARPLFQDHFALKLHTKRNTQHVAYQLTVFTRALYVSLSDVSTVLSVYRYIAPQANIRSVCLRKSVEIRIKRRKRRHFLLMHKDKETEIHVTNI